MDKENHKILNSVASYYSEKLSLYGATPAGVDWNSEASQNIRFNQLIQIIRSANEPFSINDLGCGYGALLDFLRPLYSNFEYEGVDISSEMIAVAKSRNKDKNNSDFHLGEQPTKIRDYCLASGIFSVRLGTSDELWWDYIVSTLDIINEHSKMGFSFNCLTSYSDLNMMRKELYYANPLAIFDLCKKRYSKNIALLHDYQLYEFTILVRKS